MEQPAVLDRASEVLESLPLNKKLLVHKIIPEGEALHGNRNASGFPQYLCDAAFGLAVINDDIRHQVVRPLTGSPGLGCSGLQMSDPKWGRCFPLDLYARCFQAVFPSPSPLICRQLREEMNDCRREPGGNWELRRSSTISGGFDP